MRAFVLSPDEISERSVVGRVLCHDVVAAGESGRVRLNKGRFLVADDVPALQSFPGELHVLELEPQDIHEDEASLRLAGAVAGSGLELHGPSESQTHLRSTRRGVVEVNTDALVEINRLPDISVFTLYNGQPVDSLTPVAATKVTPLAVNGHTLVQAEEIARRHSPVIQIRPFGHKSVGIVVRDRMSNKAREKFERAIATKVGWFESPVAGICYLPDDVDAIARAISAFEEQGVAVILAAGVNSTDPLDLTIQALDRLGATTEKRGVPAHPGSTCWLAYLNDTPIFGLALCGMFSRTTVLDLLLPRFLSGQPVRAEDIALFGHGGMLNKDMAFRFPPYTPAS